MSTYDLAAIQILANGTVEQALADANNKGSLVTGINKIAQRYLILFMTPKGSVPYQATFGSKFVDMLRYGGVQTETDVFSAFSAAQTDVIPQMNAQQLTTDPTNEQFVSAKLSNVTVTAGAVNMTITITTKAQALNIVLPLIFNLK